MKDLSVKRKLQLALELIAEAKLAASDITCMTVDKFSHGSLLVRTDALIRVYHHFQVPRTRVTVAVTDDYIHVSFVVKGLKLTGLVKKSEAGAFLQMNQQQLPAPKARRLNGPKSDERGNVRAFLT